MNVLNVIRQAEEKKRRQKAAASVQVRKANPTAIF